MATIVTNTEQLVAGKWYAVGFENLEGEMQWGQLVKFHGGDFWTDDSGEEVESLYDPILQTHVAMDAADAYAQQA